jgi:hypothetical protein
MLVSLTELYISKFLKYTSVSMNGAQWEPPWYDGRQCSVRRKDTRFSEAEKANLELTRHKTCLGLNCRVNSVTHPEAHFRKCKPCSRQLGINSDYFDPACQQSDWTTRHLRFHRAMLFRSGEVNPAERYPRPPEFKGRAIATGYEQDWTRAIYMNERLQMLEAAIQHVLLNVLNGTLRVHLRRLQAPAAGLATRLTLRRTGLH